MAWACKVVVLLALTIQLVTIASPTSDDSGNKTLVEPTIVTSVNVNAARPQGGRILGFNNGYVIKGKESYVVDKFGRVQDVVPVQLNSGGLVRWWSDILRDVVVNRQYVNYDYNRRYERRRDYDRRFDYYYYYGRQRPTGVIIATDALSSSSSTTTSSTTTTSTTTTTTTTTPPPYVYPFTISYAYSRPYTYPSY